MVRVLRCRAAQTALLSLFSVALIGPAAAQTRPSILSNEIDTFYSTHSSPIWFVGGRTTVASTMPIILRRAEFEGLSEGALLATQVELAIQTAARYPSTVAQMDRVISTAWVRYVQTLEQPMPDFEFGDVRASPGVENVGQILGRVAENRAQLSKHILQFSSVNPIYKALRDAVWSSTGLTGSTPSARMLANLARARIFLPAEKAIVVDARDARLYMFEDGQIVDTMKVIVGKSETPTPLIASTIYYATLNPYWNVPDELVRQLIAPRVLAQGIPYLKNHHYEVVTKYGPAATVLSPSSIDWKAVADGSFHVFVRQLPGPANSMGKVKFAFANSRDIYLHDTPNKEPFARQERFLSNGCIRLEDAQKLGRWLLGREATTDSKSPEEHVLLPAGVPIYVTYVTIRAEGAKAHLIADTYSLDGLDEAAASGPT